VVSGLDRVQEGDHAEARDRPFIFRDCRKISHRFPERAAEAKLPGKVTFHTLRHTFASRLVMAGVDLLTVKALGGWNRLEMVERYAHLAPSLREWHSEWHQPIRG
jgi:site-specific recombinase XerD